MKHAIKSNESNFILVFFTGKKAERTRFELSSRNLLLTEFWLRVMKFTKSRRLKRFECPRTDAWARSRNENDSRFAHDNMHLRKVSEVNSLGRRGTNVC